MTTLSTIKAEAVKRFEKEILKGQELDDIAKVMMGADKLWIFFSEEIDRAVEAATEEQNRVVNSGRKLFQEGQRVERERIIEEVKKIDEIATINTPTPYDVGGYHLIQKDDLLQKLSISVKP